MEFLNLIKQIWNSHKVAMILAAFMIVAFPFVLNLLVLLNIGCPVAGNPETWIAFWPSYLSAIASFGMIALTSMALFYNNKTLANNKEQLNEMKRQWDEEHSPNVSVSFSQLGNVAYLRLVNTSNVEIRNLKISGDFYNGEEKNDFFNMKLLEQFNIDIEPHGIRNIILHNNIVPLTDNFYFILQLYYNGMQKEIKVYCNDLYLVGDIIVWKQLIDSIKKIK